MSQFVSKQCKQNTCINEHKSTIKVQVELRVGCNSEILYLSSIQEGLNLILSITNFPKKEHIRINLRRKGLVD